MALKTAKFPSWAADIPDQPLSKQQLLQLKVETHEMQLLQISQKCHDRKLGNTSNFHKFHNIFMTRITAAFQFRINATGVH